MFKQQLILKKLQYDMNLSNISLTFPLKQDDVSFVNSLLANDTNKCCFIYSFTLNTSCFSLLDITWVKFHWVQHNLSIILC